MRKTPDLGFLLYSKIASYYDWLMDEMRKNPRIPTGFETPAWESPNGNAGCILPQNIEHGQFVLTTGNNYVEGKWVPPTTILLLTCGGTTNTSRFSFWCSKNVWIPSIDMVSCRPPGKYTYSLRSSQLVESSLAQQSFK